MKKKNEPTTLGFVQVGPTEVQSALVLSATVPADEQSQAKVLIFGNNTKPSYSRALDIIKSPACAKL